MTGQPYEIDLTRTTRRALAERLPLSVVIGASEFINGPLADNPHRVGKELDRPYHGGCRTRRIPTANAIDSSPVNTKLTIWIQPSSPRLSMLIGCLVGSYPSRVRAWTAAVVTNTGPATTPQSSSRPVELVRFPDAVAVAAPVVMALVVGYV